MQKNNVLAMHGTFTDESNAVIKLDELLEYIKDMPILEQNEILVEYSKLSEENNKLTENKIKELSCFLDKRKTLNVEKRKVTDVKKTSNSYKKFVNDTIIGLFADVNSLLSLNFNEFVLSLDDIDEKYLMLGIIREMNYYKRLADEAFIDGDLEVLKEAREIIEDLQKRLDFVKTKKVEEKALEEDFNIVFLETSSNRTYFLEDIKGLEEYYESFKKLFVYLKSGNPYDMKYFPTDNKKFAGLQETRDISGKTRIFFKQINENTYVVIGAMVKKVDKSGSYKNQVVSRYKNYLNKEDYILSSLVNDDYIQRQNNHLSEVLDVFEINDKTLNKRG